VFRLKLYDDCLFSVAALTLWNRFQAHIRTTLSLEIVTDILFELLLYYICFVQRIRITPAKGCFIKYTVLLMMMIDVLRPLLCTR